MTSSDSVPSIEIVLEELCLLEVVFSTSFDFTLRLLDAKKTFLAVVRGMNKILFASQLGYRPRPNYCRSLFLLFLQAL